MTTSTPPDNTILVLRPPRVIEATTPVVGAIYGVPKHVYDLKPMGLTIAVDPPASGTVDAGDVIRLVLNGASTEATKTIPDGGENNIQTLYLPIGLLLTDLVNELVYTITRGSLNKGTSTPALTLLYNRIRPGLKDRLTDPGGHSELKLLLPDAIKNGVAPDFVSAEVCVAYPYCRAYDRISLKCNGELMTADVNPNQAPQPPDHGSEVPITICFTVDRAYLDKAKRLDHKLNFSYTVIDQLGNGPDTDAPWSPAQTVDEDLDGVLLPMPILLERKEDYPGDDASIIDLEKLAGNPLLMVVITTDNRFVAGDDVLATYTAKNTGQPADVVVTVPGKVEADPFGSKKTLFLEMANDKVFAGSSVTVTYELRRPNGDLVGNSKPAKATVTGTTPIDLQPPFLVAPAVSPIDVLTYPNGVTMRIEYLSALPGDKAQLVEVDPSAGSEPFPLVAFNSNKRVNTVLSTAFLAARHGKVIELRWNLNSNGTPAGQSDSVMVSVLKIADGDSRFPKPVIAGETGQELDVSKLKDTDKLTVPQWIGQTPKQLIWLTCSGINYQGQPKETIIFNGDLNPSDSGLEITAPKKWLETLMNGTQILITFKANFSDPEAPTAFPTNTYQIRGNIPLVEDFEELELQAVTSITTQTMTITKIYGNCHILDASQALPLPGLFDRRTISIGNENSTIRFDLKRPYPQVSFWCAGVDRNCAARSYDNNGNLLDTLTISPPRDAKKYTFTAEGIQRIEIDNLGTDDAFWIDHFEFTL